MEGGIDGSGTSGRELPVLLVDSVTELRRPATGEIVVCGSHGGLFSAAIGARACVAGIVLHDAGVGLNGAGVAGLTLLASVGIPAVAVSHSSARIGDARDVMRRGVISALNDVATARGCARGQSASDAVAVLRSAGLPVRRPFARVVTEARELVRDAPVAVWTLDSASLVSRHDRDAVLVTGSHGGLLGGRASAALKYDAVGAVFNDAGGGIDGVGFARLAALDRRDIPAATVAADSAEIGSGRSSLESGVLSAVNVIAERLGAVPGMSCVEFVELFSQRETR